MLQTRGKGAHRQSHFSAASRDDSRAAVAGARAIGASLEEMPWQELGLGRAWPDPLRQLARFDSVRRPSPVAQCHSTAARPLQPQASSTVPPIVARSGERHVATRANILVTRRCFFFPLRSQSACRLHLLACDHRGVDKSGMNPYYKILPVERQGSGRERSVRRGSSGREQRDSRELSRGSKKDGKLTCGIIGVVLGSSCFHL